MNLFEFITKGYFPKELPPSFDTSNFAQYLYSEHLFLPEVFDSTQTSFKLCSHNLARSSGLRRKLSIPNPIGYYQLVDFVLNNWDELSVLLDKSQISCTTPSFGSEDRALSTKHALGEKPIFAAKFRSKSRYILQADIARFYPSIYTHSIPWAIHTKPVSKQNYSLDLIGNKLDFLIRNMNDKQTLGVPIGPDASLLIAELILSDIDFKLHQKNITSGFRYIDDYEFAFESLSEAENTLGLLQEYLNDYELELNGAKTNITRLPIPLESLAISELRCFMFRSDGIKEQQSDLLRFFDRAFDLFQKDKGSAVLRYAVARLKGEEIRKENWDLFQNLLLQCVLVEPYSIRYVLDQFTIYKDKEYELDIEHISNVLNKIIIGQAPLGHGSEVAWSLWGIVYLNGLVCKQAAEAAINMMDSIVGIILLDAKEKQLIESGVSFDRFSEVANQENLFTEHWLLSYEMGIRDWLDCLWSEDYILNTPGFKDLKEKGVSFYNTDSSHLVKPGMLTGLSDGEYF